MRVRPAQSPQRAGGGSVCRGRHVDLRPRAAFKSCLGHLSAGRPSLEQCQALGKHQMNIAMTAFLQVIILQPPPQGPMHVSMPGEGTEIWGPEEPTSQPSRAVDR